MTIFTLQCTKKLASELQLSTLPDCLNDSPPVYCWHAHLFMFNRRKCMLVMNNEARYNFVIYGLKREDFKRFDKLVKEHICENLAADGLEQVLIDRYLLGLKEVCYAKTSNKSILSQMNDVIMFAKYDMEKNLAETGELGIEQVNRTYNRHVITKLPKLFSGETMHDALQKLLM